MSEQKPSPGAPVAQALTQMLSGDMTQGLLSTALSAAVPLHILDLAARGGPTEEDLARIGTYQQDLSERGTDLFYASKRPGATAERFNQVADAIAVLSFCPGGITIFGEHYEGQKLQDQQEQQKQELYQLFRTQMEESDPANE